jgi:hypothetical protein
MSQIKPVKITPDEIRARLKSESAKIDFERINALAPQWTVKEDNSGVSLSPNIGVKPEGSFFLYTIDRDRNSNEKISCAESFDKSVQKLLKTLKQRASEEGAKIIVDSGSPAHTTEYKYDKKYNIFSRIRMGG